MKINKLFILLGFITIYATSCKKDNVAVDKDPFIPATYTRFLQVSNSGILYKRLPVKAIDNVGISIDLGITTLSGKDRMVKLSYTSNTAVRGVNYTAADTVLFKAGSSVASFKIKADYAFYNADQIDTVKIKLLSTDGLPALQGRDSIFVIIQEYCDVTNAADFNTSYFGSYTVGPNGLGDIAPPGIYEVIIDSLGMISAPTNSAIGTISGLSNIPAQGDPIRFTIDWDDPSNPSVTIDGQYFYTRPATQTVPAKRRFIKTSGITPSLFNNCKKTMEIYIDIYTPASEPTGYESVASGRWIHVE